ncbi:type VI secretion system baseplate subunit TssG [Ostreiculturibacter nitratireducens]|uniref:type VI secretion system baseplate subunit TssG n=1 Tax=Ostreiculturibacter nitratireducens TaxID=3075226 RepID=UPI0031B56C5E
MASGGGSGTDHLSHLERLSASPEKFHIFQAFRVLDAAFPDAPRIGKSRRPREDKVRFGQEAELSFPPSSISEFRPPKDDAPGRLTNRVFGLFGPHGPLPLHLTEYARARLRHHHDPTFVAFANILVHRMTTLFYRAWLSGQPAPSFDRGDNDSFERKIASISGHIGESHRGRDAFPDLAKRHFAGLLSQGPKNAHGLVSILSAFFGARVQIQQFVGSWLELEAGDQWELGRPAGLGRTTSLGSRVWSRNAKFRIRIGPLSLDEYKRLLPGGDSLDRLRSIVRSYVGDSLDWDLNLVLVRNEVPQAILGNTVRLGQTSWIGTRKTDNDADDLYHEPSRDTETGTIRLGERS